MPTGAQPRPRRRPALERVVRTADRLFYEQGIQAVGVDRIAAEADVSKATLYTHFRTKQDLVEHYLRERSRAWQAHVVAELPRRSTEPRQQLLAVFDLLGDWFDEQGFRGCPFINAEAEATAAEAVHRVNLEHRTWVRRLLQDLLDRIGATDAAAGALQLTLLYDGALVGAQTEPALPWAATARGAAARLLGD